MKPLLAALFLLIPFLGACTTIGGDPVPGWPELRIVEHHVPHEVMRSRCVPYTPPMMNPEACAEFYFAEGECHLWFSADFPPSPAIVEHEYEHCRGHEHAGETGLRALLARHLATQQASASTGPSSPR